MCRAHGLVGTRDGDGIVDLFAGSSAKVFLVLLAGNLRHQRTALVLFGHGRRRRARPFPACGLDGCEANLCHLGRGGLHADGRWLQLERFGWCLMSCVDVLDVALLGRWAVDVGVNGRLVSSIARTERESGQAGSVRGGL